MDNFENIYMINQPKELNKSLYPHQLASVYEMEKREREQLINRVDIVYNIKISILADKTGYGKSLSMIALILRDNMDWDIKTPYINEKISVYCNHTIVKRQQQFCEKLNCTLLLVDKSLVYQWANEFKLTKLKVKIILTKKSIQLVDVEDYDVIIVSSTMYNNLIQKYHNCAWKRFVYDEPSSLKVAAMSDIIANFYWFITSTPTSIIGTHKNCKNSFMYKIIGAGNHNLFFNYLPLFLVKNSDEFIEKSFIMPQTHHKYYECHQAIYNNVLGLVNSRVSQMISAGNIEGAIQCLGGNKTDNIMKLVKRKKLEELEEITSKIRIYKIRNDTERVLEWEEREQVIKLQINDLDERFSNILKSDCSICHDQITKPIMEPLCQNIFCGECLLNWLNTKQCCPLCRRNIELKNLIYITDDSSHQNNKIEIVNKNKEQHICDIISKDGKFLIYSDWDNTFDNICNIINSFTYSELKGSAKQRSNILNDFKNGKIKILFLNSRYNGSGLNLQEVTDIILYHKMDDLTQMQIIGRANRIGRKIDLNIHHLINV